MAWLQTRRTTSKCISLETYWTANGQRVFSVSMNGKYVLNDLDVFKTAGGENIAYDPQFTTSADKFGQIIVQFIYGGADQPFIDGIEAVKSGNPPPTCTAAPTVPGTNLERTSTTGSSTVGGLMGQHRAHAWYRPASVSYNVFRSTASRFDYPGYRRTDGSFRPYVAFCSTIRAWLQEPPTTTRSNRLTRCRRIRQLPRAGAVTTPERGLRTTVRLPFQEHPAR